ncbi:MAG: thiol peroxidase [Nitrospirota bacterium]
MTERKGVATMKGQPVTLLGPELKKGDKAPQFKCADVKMNDFTLENTRGKVRLIASVPSLDTSVCNKETLRWGDEAEKTDNPEVAWLVVSMDLPFAQKRFMEDEDVRGLTIISDYRYASFGENWGVLIKDLRLLQRAVFVVGKDNIIRYAEYVRETGEFPDFEAALKVLRGLTGQERRAAA